MRRWLLRSIAAIGTLLALIVLFGPLFMRANPRLLPTRTPADVGLKFEDVTFSPSDLPITLRAWLIPAVDARATIVMVHGGGEDNRSLPYGNGLELMRELVQHHYSVLALDLRNFGDSGATPDERISFGVHEADDVLAALDFLDRRGAGARYGALGFSMGGSTVIYAASRDKRLEAVVADSAFGDSRAVVGSFVKAAMGIPLWVSGPLLWSAEAIHGFPLGAGRAIDVVSAIAPRRLLVISDANDPIVRPDQARNLAAACPGAELWMTDVKPPPGNPFGTHIHSYMYAPAEYVARVTAFFDATFAR